MPHSFTLHNRVTFEANMLVVVGPQRGVWQNRQNPLRSQSRVTAHWRRESKSLCTWEVGSQLSMPSYLSKKKDARSTWSGAESFFLWGRLQNWSWLQSWWLRSWLWLESCPVIWEGFSWLSLNWPHRCPFNFNMDSCSISCAYKSSNLNWLTYQEEIVSRLSK